jgi:hypothetical protein
MNQRFMRASGESPAAPNQKLRTSSIRGSAMAHGILPGQ